jgi:putative peptidoglycan lipid II flippase
VLGIYTQGVLAATLGLSGASDAFFAALALCLFVSYVVNTSVLNREVPELARLLDPSHVPTGAFWERAWRLTRPVSVVCAALGVALFVGADWAIKLIAPGLTPDTSNLAAASLRVMSVPLAIQLCSSVLIAVQYSLQRQPLIQVTSLFYSASVIPAVLFLTPRIGPISASIGAGVSFCLMFVTIVVGSLVLARRQVSPFNPSRPAGAEPSVAIVTLASVVFYGQTIVGPLIGSTIGEGTVAQLSFAYRPVEVLARALPVVIAYTVMPTLAAAHARQHLSQAHAQASEALRVTLVLILPLSALLVAVRDPLIAVLYQRSAFSADAARIVAPTLAWYAAALPGLSIVVVLNAILFSMGRQRWPLIIGLAMLLAYVALGVVLGHIYGGIGVALAFCVTNLVGAVAGTAVSGRRDALALSAAPWFRWTIAASVMALVCGGAAVLLAHALPNLVQLFLGLVIGGGAAIVCVAAALAGSVRAGRAWLDQHVIRVLRPNANPSPR